MGRHDLILNLVTINQENEQAFIADLSPDEINKDGSLHNWSAKDMIAHVATWRARFAQDLRAARRGVQPNITTDFNHENAAIFAAHHEKSWEEVCEFAKTSFSALIQELGYLEDQDLDKGDVLNEQAGRPLWRFIVGTGFNHPMIHLSDYHKQQGDLQRAGVVLGEMAEAVRDLDDSPMWEGVVRYNLACHYTLLGRKDQAIEELRLALTANPDLIPWSKEDADLAPLRGEADYRALYA